MSRLKGPSPLSTPPFYHHAPSLNTQPLWNLNTFRRWHECRSVFVFVSLSVCQSFCFTDWLWFNATIKNEGNVQLTLVRLWRRTLRHLCWSWMTPSSIFSKYFRKSRQFVCVALCQYIPRCRHPEYTRNSCGFAVWIDVKFHDGLPKRWQNKCLDCCSSANHDFSLMLLTNWGQGVYKTWVWSADCGFKPNGHTICPLLPNIIKPPTMG